MKKKNILFLGLLLSIVMPYSAFAMHIAEGFLSPFWCIVYFVLSAPSFS